MFQSFILASLALVASSSVAAAETPTAPERVLADYIRATNSHDFRTVAPLIADDALYWFPDGSYLGKAAIAKVFEATWKQVPDEIYSVDRIRWLTLSETSAAVSYDYHWRASYRGKPAEGGGRATNVLEKRKGHWVIVHEHLSAPPRRD